MAGFKSRWGITSNFQVAVIVVAFAITGSSAALVSKPLLGWLGISKETVSPWLYYVIYLVVILPAYQILLVLIGSILGQFRFFWAFEKKLLRMVGLGFLFPDQRRG
jgi:hypothetical protein